MIFLPLKDVNNPPAQLINPGARRQLLRVTTNANPKLFTRSYYPHETVTNELRAYSIRQDVLYTNDQPKCNYCESQVEKGLTFQVEHYRPKANIDPIDTNGVAHPGYYWLGIEWSNLLLACSKCNSKKGDRFPIRGVRAIAIHPVDQNYNLNRNGCFVSQNPLLAEDPLLLNPEVDHPEVFLTFDPNGYMDGHGQDSIRGNTSIEIYDLNRDALLASRIDVLNKFIQKIITDIGAHMIGTIGDETLNYNFKAVIRDIIARKSPSQEFTLWAMHFNDNIESCVVDFIPADLYKDRFRLVYQQVLAE